MIDLRQGDCLEILPTLPDASVDFVFTDPPYGHRNNDDGDLISRWEAALGRPAKTVEPESRPILNDGPEANSIFRSCVPHFRRLLRRGGCCCCCCGGGGPDPQFARWSLWLDEHLDFKQMVVWDKGRMGLGWHYRRSYETVLVAAKPGGKCAWYDDTRRVENVIRPGDYGIRKIIPRADQHPTEKPVELAMHFIGLHTKPGDTVLDPFSGGGSTALACHRLGRNFIGIELDPVWHDYARRRVEAARGEAA